MATSKFKLQESFARAATLDGKDTSTNYGGFLSLGLLYIGTTKGTLRRAIATFDVLGTPVEGSPLTGAETITAAQIDCTAAAVTGLTSQANQVHRVTRADWVTAETDWIEYKSGSNWTAAGGDVDATTPTPVTYTSPAGNGAFTITGLINFVTDAIASRSGIVNLRFKFTSEDDDGAARVWQAAPLSDIVLTVTYTATPQTVAGSFGFTGALTTLNRRAKTVAGAFGFSGTLATKTARLLTLTGSLGFSGTLATKTARLFTVAGAFGFNGAVTTAATIRQTVAGAFGFAGAVASILILGAANAGRRLKKYLHFGT